MPRPRRLADEQAERVLMVHAARCRLLEALRKLPTLEQLSDELEVSLSVVKGICYGATYRHLRRQGCSPQSGA